ncbi:MAG: bifunctional phosphoribosyl-AMP cyclohydrolase/phosphoribosyl-ATP diphosphatase HisIE [Gemmatimonadaceae bacterium]|nr:bifunctional phosphoribosyl-AMP cyclohydrolase/phosphoribosyl-ATP diphosphatase HisIE [Gemmatimonadaceae bacterium]
MLTLDLDSLDFTKGDGVVTVVAQDARTGTVLMVAAADRQALERSLATGEMHYRSRSRGLWHKGATSGNVQRIVSLDADCDADAVLARVEPAGPACHTGETSCFGARATASDVIAQVDATIVTRMKDGTATASYTARLLADRNLRLKKLGEEMAELVTACADADAARASEEGADVIYHLLVALRAAGSSLDAVQRVLVARAGQAPRETR